MSTPKLQKYLRKRATTRPVVFGRSVPTPIRRVVVIPAYEEAEHLPRTIESLENVPEASLSDTLVLAVVNNPPLGSSPFPEQGAAHRVAADNRRTLAWLQAHSRVTPLQLAWIDASSPGNELAAPGGVGQARKIGSDSALLTICETHETGGHRFDPSRTVLLHLDADTLVQEDYLDAADELLGYGTAGGAIAYAHSPADSAAGQHAIDCYELFMRHYVHGLAWAGSPYAFHTVGSTMACTCSGYVQSDGMPGKRQAGEDFYFLQQLAKVGGVHQLRSTTVYPSPRISDRVPFGTGPRMADALCNGNEDFNAYDTRTFAEVRRILQAVTTASAPSAESILAAVDAPETADFLLAKGLALTMPRLRKQHQHRGRLIQAFHQWFDGLATFRLIHHLTETRWPQRTLLEAWQDLLSREGCVAPTNDVSALLDWCRSVAPGETER